MTTQETVDTYTKDQLIPLCNDLIDYGKSKNIPAPDFYLVCMQLTLHGLDQCKNFFDGADDLIKRLAAICDALATEEAERRANVRRE